MLRSCDVFRALINSFCLFVLNCFVCMLACFVLLLRSWFVCLYDSCFCCFCFCLVCSLFCLFVLHWLVYMLAFWVLRLLSVFFFRFFFSFVFSFFFFPPPPPPPPFVCLLFVVLLTMGAAGNVLPSATELLPLRPDSASRVSYLLVSPPPGGVTQHGQSVKDHAQSPSADDAVSSTECFLFTFRLSLHVTVRG